VIALRVNVAGLCELVPGFADLHSEDKATLMEASYFDLWLVISVSLLLAQITSNGLLVWRAVHSNKATAASPLDSVISFPKREQ